MAGRCVFWVGVGFRLESTIATIILDRPVNPIPSLKTKPKAFFLSLTRNPTPRCRHRTPSGPPSPPPPSNSPRRAAPYSARCTRGPGKRWSCSGCRAPARPRRAPARASRAWCCPTGAARTCHGCGVVKGIDHRCCYVIATDQTPLPPSMTHSHLPYIYPNQKTSSLPHGPVFGCMWVNGMVRARRVSDGRMIDAKQ